MARIQKQNAGVPALQRRIIHHEQRNDGLMKIAQIDATTTASILNGANSLFFGVGAHAMDSKAHGKYEGINAQPSTYSASYQVQP